MTLTQWGEGKSARARMGIPSMGLRAIGSSSPQTIASASPAMSAPTIMLSFGSRECTSPARADADAGRLTIEAAEVYLRTCNPDDSHSC